MKILHLQLFAACFYNLLEAFWSKCLKFEKAVVVMRDFDDTNFVTKYLAISTSPAVTLFF